MPRKSASLMASPRPADEKITINVSCVDLGQIDLLVQEGFYANRTDLIRTAIRNQLATQVDVVRQVVSSKSLVLGIQRYGADDLQGPGRTCSRAARAPPCAPCRRADGNRDRSRRSRPDAATLSDDNPER